MIKDPPNITGTCPKCGNDMTDNQCKPEPGANYGDWSSKHTTSEIGFKWD